MGNPASYAFDVDEKREQGKTVADRLRELYPSCATDCADGCKYGCLTWLHRFSPDPPPPPDRGGSHSEEPPFSGH